MKEKLITIFREVLELDNSAYISITEPFREFENWDSLAQLSLIAALDENFNVQIEQAEFKELITVEDIEKAILKLNNK